MTQRTCSICVAKSIQSPKYAVQESKLGDSQHLVDLARGRGMPLYTKSLTKLRDCSVIGFDRWEGRFFLSFEVRDESGIMAGIAGALASQGVSIALLQQQVTKQDAPARLLLMTHVTAKKKVDQSLESMRGEPWLLAEPTKMMILDD